VHDKILARDAALLKDAVREAGALALALFRTELKNWTKGASSPVSEADIRVNDLLEKRLRSATPDYGWLSEESADDEARLGKPLVSRCIRESDRWRFGCAGSRREAWTPPLPAARAAIGTLPRPI
jgi:3'-phosphoadenosine 5'-phosphosulfate (PAPS) 3'-phosphatase